jgi:hypothetical protein
MRFLHGRGSPQRRFQDWVQAVADLPQRGKVLTWPVVTVFGFLARPDRHLFLKPRVTRKAAQPTATTSATSRSRPGRSTRGC